MKIYKTQEEVGEDIKDGILSINGDVRFECDVRICADIITWGVIYAQNLFADDIYAFGIEASNISYFGFCCVYQSIICNSIKGRSSIGKPRAISLLEGEITVRKQVEKLKIGELEYSKKEVEEALRNIKPLN